MLSAFIPGNPAFEELENRFLRLASKADLTLGYPGALVLGVFFVFVG